MRLPTIVTGLLVAGILTLATGTLDAPAQAAARSSESGIGIRLLEAPVAARADKRAWAYIVDHLAPGTVIHRRVEVFNTTGSPKQLSIYSAAAQIRDRKFQFADDHTANELSAWTSMDRHEVVLPPEGRAPVTVTVAVPDDAAPGERYAMIWAETAKAAPPGGGLAQINRVGIRLYLDVGRGNPPPSDFTIDSLTAQRSPDGQQAVMAQVHNTGGRALDLSGDLKLTSSSGSQHHSAGPYRVQTGTTLAPGDTGSVTATLTEQVPDGPWRARMRLESGLTKRSAEATIRFPAAGAARAVKAEMDTDPYLMVALAVGAFLAVLAAITFLLIQRKRRSRREPSNA
ncbi:peptidase [Streptosporangium sp. NPDC000563]|uniref:peptidase n=1 Tax=Streptosporangium sp. NPDC000563 TaxID=3154366 RepID=UPI00332CBF21